MHMLCSNRNVNYAHRSFREKLSMFGTELGKLGRRDRSLIEPRGL